MKNKIKAIIFDWGRTLHNPETDELFDGVPELVEKLARSYDLALVTLVKSDPEKKRRQKIEDSGIEKFFKLILIGGEEKNEMYEKTIIDLGVTPEETMVVDDRIIRGIAWGNCREATTVWLKKGKFASELPTVETGNPTYIIKEIKDLEKIAKM